jgi:hypothetical protein
VKKFLALYLGSASAAEKTATVIDDDTRASGMAAWSAWMQKHEASIVDAGGPLGATMKASAKGVTDAHNALTGYVIVQAASHAAAASMFEGHPHFSIFPGDSIEIVECVPMPGSSTPP